MKPNLIVKKKVIKLVMEYTQVKILCILVSNFCVMSLNFVIALMLPYLFPNVLSCICYYVSKFAEFSLTFLNLLSVPEFLNLILCCQICCVSTFAFRFPYSLVCLICYNVSEFDVVFLNLLSCFQIRLWVSKFSDISLNLM